MTATPVHKRAEHRLIGAVVLVAVVVRVVVLLSLPSVFAFERTGVIHGSEAYDIYAQNLLATGVYGLRPAVPDAVLPPLYSVLLAGVYAIAGRGILGVATIQIALDVLSIVTLIAIGRRLLPGSLAVGLLAGLFFGLYPYLVFQCLVLSDTAFFVLLLHLFVLSAVLLWERTARTPRTTGLAALGGLALGCAVLTRSDHAASGRAGRGLVPASIRRARDRPAAVADGHRSARHRGALDGPELRRSPRSGPHQRLDGLELLAITVIPNGVDGEYFAPRAVPDGPPTLIFVGNFAYGPNQLAATSLVREVLPAVRASIPAARLTLVGADPPPAIRRLASDAVTVTGWVPDVRPYLAAATCFVSPLTEGAGMRNKILEALAMEVPVVATPLSCDGIGVHPGQDVLFGPTPPALANQVVALLGDQALRRRIGQAGRVLVTREYSWEAVASRYEALYAEVIGSTRNAAVARRAR